MAKLLERFWAGVVGAVAGAGLGLVGTLLMVMARFSLDFALQAVTVTAKHRFGLVTVYGEQYVIADIGLRMLTPRELYRAQGFHDEYIIDPIFEEKPLSKTAQVRMCGNSVCPPNAAAMVRAQFGYESFGLAA